MTLSLSQARAIIAGTLAAGSASSPDGGAGRLRTC